MLGNPKTRTMMPAAFMAIAGMILGSMVGPGIGMEGSIGLTQSASDQHWPGDIIVAAGETLPVEGHLIAQSITISGALVNVKPGPLYVEAGTIIVREGGEIRGHDALRPTSAPPNATRGADGLAGGDIVIQAEAIRVAPGALLAAGSGSAGASLVSLGNATGGDGGQGGSIFVWSPTAQLEGTLAPGRGGDGGHAASAGHGNLSREYAMGGNGGPSGSVYLNGVKEFAELPFTPAPPSVIARRLVDALGPLIEGDLPGLNLLDCQPTGAPGQHSTLGDGGRGGDGCSRASGADGPNGADGNSGWFGCTAGGPGGLGADAAAGAAAGGRGGDGFNDGGAGGNATSSASGGNGGTGGNGGKASIGADCPGGHGGKGGSGKGGDVAGGAGGNGTCGYGGAGGSASSDGHGGSGGAGGSGNPSGAPGANGMGIAGSGSGSTGVGGTGLNIGCRPLP